MFIPSTFKRPVSSWKALNLRKTLLMASSVRLKPLNCSRFPCVYAQETLTFLLFFFNDTATTEIYTLSLHDALPISAGPELQPVPGLRRDADGGAGRHREPHRPGRPAGRSEEHTSELQSRLHLVCRLLLEKKKKQSVHVRGGLPLSIAHRRSRESSRR